MKTIIQGHAIKTDEYGEVICPRPNQTETLRIIKAGVITYRCKCGHIHAINEFPSLNTNDIKPGQIHRRG